MYQLISMASTVYQMLSWTSALHFQGKRQGGSRDAASLRESLNALSVASLAFPQVHLGLAEVEVEDPRSISKLESQLMAGGGGNTVAGLLLYRKKIVDNMEQIRDREKRVWFEVS